MPYYALLAGLSYGLVDGEPIFIDLAADLYFRVDPLLRDDLDRLRRAGGALPRARARRLLEAGLVGESPIRRPAGPSPAFIPAESLVDRGPCPDARWSDLLEVAFLLVRARLAIRWIGLGRLIAGLVAPEALEGCRDQARTLARRFEAARRRVPLGRRCLADSIALLHFLRRRSTSASLLFGVKLHPFAAHCWLQDKEMVLNDDCNTAADFTPVLLV